MLSILAQDYVITEDDSKHNNYVPTQALHIMGVSDTEGYTTMLVEIEDGDGIDLYEIPATQVHINLGKVTHMRQNYMELLIEL